MGIQDDKKEKQIEERCFSTLYKAYQMGYNDVIRDMQSFLDKLKESKDYRIEEFINNEYKSTNV